MRTQGAKEGEHVRYAFADCVLDTARRELRRAGEVVKLEPKTYGVLVYLVQHAERVVTHEELLEHVWDGAFVELSAIARNISYIRQAVGDHDHRTAPQVIQTFPRLGYRFVALVTVLDATMSPTEPQPLPAGAPAPPASTQEVPISTTDPRPSPPETADAAASRVLPAPLQDVFVQAQQASAEAC
jgi:DNA-binding winged helix-turn-helix (wHTH) protein